MLFRYSTVFLFMHLFACCCRVTEVVPWVSELFVQFSEIAQESQAGNVQCHAGKSLSACVEVFNTHSTLTRHDSVNIFHSLPESLMQLTNLGQKCWSKIAHIFHRMHKLWTFFMHCRIQFFTQNTMLTPETDLPVCVWFAGVWPAWKSLSV